MKLFKEITLSILILIVILITMGIVLYDKLPSLKKIPSAQAYTKSLEAEKILEEVVNQADSQAAIRTQRNSRTEVKTAISENKITRGRDNPFAEESASNNSGTSTTPGRGNSGATDGGRITDNKEKGLSK